VLASPLTVVAVGGCAGGGGRRRGRTQAEGKAEQRSTMLKTARCARGASRRSVSYRINETDEERGGGAEQARFARLAVLAFEPRGYPTCSVGFFGNSECKHLSLIVAIYAPHVHSM
jgi:hypothetical protein